MFFCVRFTFFLTIRGISHFLILYHSLLPTLYFLFLLLPQPLHTPTTTTLYHVRRRSSSSSSSPSSFYSCDVISFNYSLIFLSLFPFLYFARAICSVSYSSHHTLSLFLTITSTHFAIISARFFLALFFLLLSFHSLLLYILCIFYIYYNFDSDFSPPLS